MLTINSQGRELTFKFSIDNDQTLRAQPVPADSKALGAINPRELEQTQPQVLFPNYRAHDLFKLNGDLYVTLSNSILPDSRYIMQLRPELRFKPGSGKDGVARTYILRNPVVKWVAIPAGFLTIGIIPTITGILLAKAARAVSRPQPGRYATMWPYSDIAKSPASDRLTINRFRFVNTEVADVLMEDPEGRLFSLVTKAPVPSCDAFLSGTY